MKTTSVSTYEGLSSVSDSSFDELYIRQGTDFNRYKKVFIKPILVNYSDKRRQTSGLYKPADFEFDEKELKQFQDQFVKAVTNQWDWELTQQLDKDAIILEVVANDFYLYGSIKNDKPFATDTLTYESSSMDILAKLRDGQTGELLLVSNDKRKTGSSRSGVGSLQKLTSVRYFNDAYHAFNRWAGGMSKYIN